MRKTIKVETIRSKVNRMLAVPTRLLPTDQKQVLCSLLEEVLIDTNNYKGFRWNMSVAKAKTVEPGDAEYYSRVYY